MLRGKERKYWYANLGIDKDLYTLNIKCNGKRTVRKSKQSNKCQKK